MKTRWLATVVAMASLLGGAPILPAQETTGKATEEQIRQAERQLREQERQMKELERQLRDAERQMRDAAREYARLSGEQARQNAKVVWYGKRARLGVVLDPDPDADSARTGARITAVTPGGPADQAGLKAGDIVVTFDGRPLVGVGDEGPTAALIELAGDLEDGQEIPLEYRRGNNTLKVTVTARVLGPTMLHVGEGDITTEIEIPEVIEIDEKPGFHWEQEPRGVRVRVVTEGASWLDMEMVSLNPELADYFGAEQGVLVVRAPEDSDLELKSGDVIVGIGGRPVSKPSQVLKILRSYEPGEKVALNVLRKRANLTLDVEAPERHGHYMVAPPVPPAPPAPPAKPAKPAPPAPPAPGDV